MKISAILLKYVQAVGSPRNLVSRPVRHPNSRSPCRADCIAATEKKQIYVSLYRAQSTEYRAQCRSFSMFEFILLDLDTAGGKDSWTRSGSRYH